MRRTRRTRTTMALTAAAIVAGSLLGWRSRHASPDTEWEPYRYTLGDTETTESFVVKAQVCARHARAEGRILNNVQDPHNYYCVLLSTGQTKLGRVEGGSWANIGGGRPVGLTPGRSHEVIVKRDLSQLEVYIDGAMAASAFDASLSGGKTAFGAREGSVSFADIIEQPVAEIGFDDDFTRQPDELGEWEVSGGEWRVQALENVVKSGTGFNYLCMGGQSSLSLAGHWFWHEYEISASCQPHGPGKVGLVAHYSGPDSYYVLEWSSADAGEQEGATASALRLVRVCQGKRNVLASAEGAYQPGQWYRLGLLIERGQVHASVDGSPVLTASDEGLAPGRIGLYVDGAKGATFDDVRVREGSKAESAQHARRLRPIVTYQPTLSSELGGASYAEAGDWDLVAEGRTAVNWHRAHVPDDAEICLELSSAPSAPISLMLSAEERRQDAGYAFVLSPGAETKAALTRKGVAVASAVVDDLPLEQIETVKLSRFGAVLVGCVNDQELFRFTDTDPLRGGRVGWAGPKDSIDPASVIVFSPNVICDTFRKAPVNWWMTAGPWTVTSRWDCDARGAFLSVESKELACVWHKYGFGGDVVLEFCGAAAHHINATICADGNDLTSGYSLMLGTKDGQGALLMRGQQILARNDKVAVSGSSGVRLHWHYVKVEKRESRVCCWHDDSLLFAYTDSEPLTGNHIALWAYNGRLSVCRVRISSKVHEPPPFSSGLSGPCGAGGAEYDEAARQGVAGPGTLWGEI